MLFQVKYTEGDVLDAKNAYDVANGMYENLWELKRNVDFFCGDGDAAFIGLFSDEFYKKFCEDFKKLSDLVEESKSIAEKHYNNIEEHFESSDENAKNIREG